VLLREPVSLLGFSVGASIIWMNSALNNLPHVRGALCFYGSQIRNFSNINPRFPVSLVFPLSEKHFSVPELIDDLISKQNVQILQSPYLHGFMNYQSKNFDPLGHSQYLQIIKSVATEECLSDSLQTKAN
jgi:dienelactone hydrolase